MPEQNEAQEHFTLALKLSVADEDDSRLDERLSHLNSAIDLGLPISDEAIARVLRGGIYKNQGLLAEAEAELQKALELNEKSEKKFSPLLYVSAYTNMAGVYEAMGDVERSIRYLSERIEFLEDYLEPDQSRVAIAGLYAEMGRISFVNSKEESEVEQAISYSQQALSNNPQHPDAHLALGLIYSREATFQPEYAIKHLEEYLDTFPNDDGKWGLLGNVYARIGQHDKAIECLNRALELNPNNERAQSNLAEIQEEQGEASGEENKKSVSFLFEGTDCNSLASAVESLFAEEGYKLEKGSPQNAIYGKGHWFFGYSINAFATMKRYKFRVNIFPESNMVRLNISKAITGVLGGIMGPSAVKEEFNRIIALHKRSLPNRRQAVLNETA